MAGREEKVNCLTESKEVFESYVKKFYERKKFPNSSNYFHKRALKMIRSAKNYKIC